MSSIFVVCAPSNPEALAAAITTTYPNEHLALKGHAWLVSAEGTSKEIAASIGIGDLSSGSALVVRFGGYWGRQPSNVWEWIESRSSAK